MSKGGDCRKLTANKWRREGNKNIKDPGTHLPPSLGDKIYNERSLTNPDFPLTQSGRRQLALKMMSMDIYIYIYIYNLLLFPVYCFFFHLGEKSSSDAPLRGIVNDAFREF